MNYLNTFCSRVALAAIFGVTACAQAPSAETGDDQQLIAGACKVRNEKLKRDMTAKEILALKDPVALAVLQSTGGCPTTLDEIAAKLRKTDSVNCKDDPAQPPAGSSVHLVSERAQVLKKPDSYRAVVARSCNNRGDHELLMSLFGVTASATKLPQESVEMMGFDKTAGVFNYYARENNKWTFFGSSKDLIGDGYNCDANGACVPKAASKTRCASCHLGGGLVMKEFDSPWVHWEHIIDTPGAADLAARFKMTWGATKEDGLAMEGTVRNGNSAWNDKRVDFLKTKSVAELLRPLFCTVDVNLQSMVGSSGSVPSSVRNDFLLDPRIGGFDSVPIDSADYTALAAANGQAVKDQSGAPLKDKDGKAVTDTVFAWTFPERGVADKDYVDKLVSKKIIDDDFAADVLSIDMTRPVFSARRCELINFAPSLTAAQMTPQGIRDGFKKSLAGKTGDAAELLAKINDVADTQKHKDAATKYLAACKARPKKEFLADALAYSGQLRTIVKKSLVLMEFAEAMQSDKFDGGADKRSFDPATCTLK